MSSPPQNCPLPSPSATTELPKHAERLQQAQAHFARGEFRDAEALCERVLRKRPADFDALYLLAGIRHALGKLPEALDALGRALRVNPRSPQILINHGMLLAALGRRDEALASYDRATAIGGDFAAAHNGRGCVLLDLSRPGEALESFDRALAVNPADAEALSNRSSALIALQGYAEALSSCDRALALRPRDLRALCNRAYALHKLDRHAEALAGYDAVLAIDPAHARAMSGRGVALNRLERWDEAIAAHDRAVALDPRSADAWSNRGNALIRLDRPEDALASYGTALAINPHHLDALTNRGAALLKAGDPEEALASHDRALALDPLFANAWSNRGAALRWQGRTVEAIADYDRALAIEPRHVTALINRGAAFLELGRIDQAIADRERALEISPDNADARFGKAEIKLLRGDLSDGWKDYESRIQVADFGHWKVTYDKPRWTGEPLEGRTLLLHAEQGLGDTIQFLRYARLMAAKAGAKARIVLGVQRPLLRLASRIGEFAQVIAPGDRLPDFDFHYELMSLPLAFNTTLETIPRTVPYLDADAAQVAAWRRRLEGLPGLKVGLVWAGGSRPELPFSYAMDLRRSVTLAHFAEFAGMPGVSFVSLQKDGPAAQAKSPPDGLLLHDWTDELGDFTDTAALVEALDLVISVDTAVAHLAGALGKPVWLLNRFDTCWRWLLGRDDSPWYPTLRQFRQTKPGEWDPVLSRVRDTLAELAAGRADGSLRSNEPAGTERPPASATPGLDQRDVVAWIGRGNTHVTELRYREAVADYDAAIAIDQNNVDAWTNRGVALQNDGRIAEAIASHDRALSLQPRCVNAWDNRAGALFLQGRSVEAIADYGRALALEPERVGTLYNRSGALRALGRLDEAAADLDRALAINPDFAEARFERSTIRLLRGDLTGAWADYESRLKVRGFGNWRHTFDKPRWTGEPLEGRTLLLHAEQGLGDTIQFLRYARLMAAKAGAKARIVLGVQRPLLRLASRIGEISRVIAPDDRLPDFDFHYELMSLPFAFNTTLETIPRAVPYLDADAAQVAAWRRRLDGLPGLKVGLVWAGGSRPDMPLSHAMDRRRSVTLARFASFAGMPGVSFVSLQKGGPAAEAKSPPAGLRLHDWTDELGDFTDTAALIEALDLVISVDTAVAHLAGALGKPVWLLNRFDTCWRWLLGRDDSPWYPTLRQFRQDKPGEWEPVLARVRDALAGFVAGRAEQAPAPATLGLDPGDVVAWVGRGNANVTEGRYREAVADYDAALTIDQNNVDAWTNRGVALQNDGRLAEAIASHDRALSLQPRCVNAWDNRAGALFLQGRTAEAIADYGRALALEPNRVGTLYNRSGALRALGRFDAATADLDQALAIDPHFAEARFGRSTIRLLRGDLKGAWADYESRLEVRGFDHWRRTFDKPRWTGEPIDGRTLLLHAEQGFGDTIQFLRYARLMAAKEAGKTRVVLEVQRPLLRLAARMGEFAEVVAAGERLPDFDLHCPLLSLPLVFGTTLETIPCTVPYLDADAMQIAQWRRRLGALPGLKVGLVWAGGFRPGLPIAHEMDRRRSVTLAHFASFAGMPGVSFVSLQKDAPAAQAKSPPAGLVVHDWTDELGDFADTAALVAALDLVISVDTSVAHLAGALGKPVWLLNRFDSEWRWLLDREDSPWYPTLRQFRQAKPGEWEPVLSRVRDALAELRDAEALFDRAYALRKLNRHAEALAGYDAVLAIEPAHARAMSGRGLVLDRLGRLDDAIAAHDRAVALAPRSADAWSHRGNTLMSLDRPADALASYATAIAIDPHHLDALTNRGVALLRRGDADEALASHDRALALYPRFADALNNRGVTLQWQGRTVEAIADYDRVLAIESAHVTALINRSAAFVELGRLDEAIADRDRALAIEPDNADVRFGKSTIQLLRGNFAEGWKAYESRLKVVEFGHWRRTFDKPRWTGEPIEGRTLLLHAEQGLGDTIQFLRYARLMAAKSAGNMRVVLEVQRPLLRLAARMREFAGVVAAGERLPDFDLHCPLLSLPLVFGTTLETIPRAVRYLDADATQIAAWRRRLAALPGLKVGLVWAGGFRPEVLTAHAIDRRRSITLAHFADFAGMTGVSFVSLQKDAPAAQTRSPPAGLVVHDWTDELGDFADTAALVEALDLVISVDTSVAHLAGALGKPVWLLNRFDSEWRWLLDREDSPWYPTLRQFRQPAPGEWGPVLSRVRDSLAALAAGR